MAREIFGESFDPYVRNQLDLRSQILSTKRSDGGRSDQFLSFADAKAPFIRLTSAVNITQDKLKQFFNSDDDEDLALKFILEGGTLYTETDTTNAPAFQRGGLGSNGGVYGSAELGGRSDVGIRPMPGISDVQLKSVGAMNGLRDAVIKIDCHDINQLQAIELLYMRPGFHCLLEWGHTQYYKELGGD